MLSNYWCYFLHKQIQKISRFKIQEKAEIEIDWFKNDHEFPAITFLILHKHGSIKVALQKIPKSIFITGWSSPNRIFWV